MISNNKKTGRGRATCKFEAELTDLFATKHNIIPPALSGRNGLVMREEQNSDTDNNASSHSSVNNYDIQNDLDESNSIAGTSTNTSVAETSTANILEKNKIPQKMKNRRKTENLNKCLTAIETLTTEMKSEREKNQNIQVQILDEYKNIKNLQEEFMKSTREQWAAANAQRQERNGILKEIANNYCDKEMYL